MYEYDEDCLKVFLKNQSQLFDEPVAETLEEAEAFLEDCMAVIVDSLEEVREYFEENGADVDGMSDEELEEASEVFALPGGQYLVGSGSVGGTVPILQSNWVSAREYDCIPRKKKGRTERYKSRSHLTVAFFSASSMASKMTWEVRIILRKWKYFQETVCRIPALQYLRSPAGSAETLL